MLNLLDYFLSFVVIVIGNIQKHRLGTHIIIDMNLVMKIMWIFCIIQKNFFLWLSNLLHLNDELCLFRFLDEIWRAIKYVQLIKNVFITKSTLCLIFYDIKTQMLNLFIRKFHKWLKIYLPFILSLLHKIVKLWKINIIWSFKTNFSLLLILFFLKCLTL